MAHFAKSGLLLSIKPRKRFARPAEFGFAVFGGSSFGSEFRGIAFKPFGTNMFGDVEFGEYLLLSGVYQNRKSLGVNGTLRMKYYQPLNPRTIPQQANRSKFANAIIAWQGLTFAEKLVYNSRAVGKHKSGYNIKISEYMAS